MLARSVHEPKDVSQIKKNHSENEHWESAAVQVVLLAPVYMKHINYTMGETVIGSGRVDHPF